MRGHEPKHGLYKVIAMLAVQPGRPHDQAVRTAGQCEICSPKLCASIGAYGRGRIVWVVETSLATVENVIRGNVDEACALASGRRGDGPNALRIYLKGKFFFAL